MAQENRIQVGVERVVLTSDRPIDEVLADVNAGIGQADIAVQAKTWAQARTYPDFEEAVRAMAGPSGLTRFMHIGLDTALRKNPDITPYRLERIIAGNPVTMSGMTRYVPHAGSYAPVTILIWQAGDQVNLAYDTMVSYLRPYGDERALAVAKELDDEVLTLLRAAAG
ncbi:DUF302 domain-containing protein [Paractinoplanes atraurantiacus]|uniref:DUF302 domain-containing protein n=1 Tax=Paractinoplanes atraurantiacus TaxID=1036182 RepID=A0A285J0A0_9ACTN|nr:DUF302 domain-containing protein [Actinoplanes atraurantiacus]SNY53664.1 hypothetical protein SAMN05421748_114124 [Actinoplanes atraurantiacus]